MSNKEKVKYYKEQLREAQQAYVKTKNGSIDRNIVIKQLRAFKQKKTMYVNRFSKEVAEGQLNLFENEK